MTEVVRVFIASPADVAKERELVVKAIELLNGRLSRLYDCLLQPINWQDFALVAEGSKQPFQDRILPWVKESQIFLGIVHKRYGTPPRPRSRVSGTEEEFAAALGWRERLQILTYFRTLSGSEANEPDVRKVLSLKDRLKAEKLLVTEYDSPESFLPHVLMDLMECVIKRMPDWQHRNELKQFFQLGQSYNQGSPRVLICVPPTFGESSGRDKSPVRNDWQTRLVPNVVYEDFKAVQRLEAAVRRIGIRGVRAVTTTSPDVREHGCNRIWLCVPRNELAQHRLMTYPQAKFRLGEYQGDGRRALLWRRSPSQQVIVRSPLDRYLRRRGPEAKSSPWRAHYGEIVARDFAVVARFCDRQGHIGRAEDGHPLWEYFVFGIRGLGTWGAAWYIHHRPRDLAELLKTQTENGGDVQLLLQVTYANGRIVEVVPVHNRGQMYFDNELTEENVASVVDHWSHLLPTGPRLPEPDDAPPTARHARPSLTAPRPMPPSNGKQSAARRAPRH